MNSDKPNWRGRSNTWDSIYNLVDYSVEGVSGLVDAAISYIPASDSLDEFQEPEGKGQVQIRSKTKLFGTPLKYLILDENRCYHAKMEPHVGIPNGINRILRILNKRLDTPELFRRRSSKAELEVIREALEAEAPIPPGTKIHTIAHCFLQWLYELPEPLLGHERFDAFLVVNKIDGESDRLRNMTLMIDEVSPWNRVMLLEVIQIFSTALNSENSEKNGLNLSAVVTILAPVLLRSELWQIAPPASASHNLGNKQYNSKGVADFKSIEQVCLIASIVGKFCFISLCLFELIFLKFFII